MKNNVAGCDADTNQETVMAGNTWEELQEALKLALAPLKARQHHYSSGLKRFRQLLVNNFISQVNGFSYLEHAKPGQRLFDFNAIKPQLETCFLDDHQLIEVAPSLVQALDERALASLFLLDEQQGIYSLKKETIFTPKAQRFLEQFACALSLYRINLAILDTYNQLLAQPELSVEPYMDCLTKAKNLHQKIFDHFDQDSIHADMASINQLQSTIDGLREPSVNGSLLIQKQRMNMVFSQCGLKKLLDERENQLVEAHKAFPDETYFTWILWDSAWKNFLKEISTSLFHDVVAPSFLSLQATLTPLETLVPEFDAASEVLPESVIAFKRELLMAASVIASKAEAKLKDNASQFGVSLNQPPVSDRPINWEIVIYSMYGFFSSQGSSSMAFDWNAKPASDEQASIDENISVYHS